jgi:predicted ATPase/DNA-binding SARP family transcriptional activator
MSLLQVSVLGSPEIILDGIRLTFPLRKAQALLVYLAVEGGMHSRSKLAAFLWPDSKAEIGRIALRNVLVSLRRLLVDTEVTASQQHYLLVEQGLLGLNQEAPLELDLREVERVYQQIQKHSSSESGVPDTVLIAQCQQVLALVRGPFLDGFWLGEDAPFDEWREQQQRYWQVRLLTLLDRLSLWQESAGEWESARATLTRWVMLDPLAEEAYLRLMRIALAQGNTTASLHIYTTLQTQLAEALQTTPSPETVALAEHSRMLAAHDKRPERAMESSPPSQLASPLLGRAKPFRCLVENFQRTLARQPQVVLIAGEAGIGKTRLADEFVAWVGVQGADVLRGHAFEIGGRLPYQSLVEALRERLETENAPDDLLEDVWLAELSRLLPELRVRYPDLPIPTEDEFIAKGRLFEAVAQFLDALAERAPVVLLLDDLQWVDEASLDLLRYLGHSWKEQGSRVLLLGTVRSEEVGFNPQFSAQLVNLGRDLPVTHVSLQPLNREETLQFVEALVVEQEPGRAEQLTQKPQRPLLSDFLFTQTGGHPFYLLEMLKLLREREWLVPQLGAHGTWQLTLTREISTAIAQERLRHELFPPSVRSLIQARIAKLSPPSRQLVMASAVLGTQSSAQNLCQVAQLDVQTGIEALEEALKSGLLCAEVAHSGRQSTYRFVHDLIRDIVYMEISDARRQDLHQQAFAVLQSKGVSASELAYHALLAGEKGAAYYFSVQAGMDAVTIVAIPDALGCFEQARTLLQDSERLQNELPASEIEHLYAHLGRVYAFQNAWGKAQSAYEELLTYAQRKAYPALICQTLNRLAILAVQQAHEKPKARRYLEQALQIAELNQDQRALAETAWNLSLMTAILWESPTQALPYAQQALSIAQAVQDTELEARSLFALGWIHLLTADYEASMRTVRAAIHVYELLENDPVPTVGLSLPSFVTGAPLTQSLTNRAAEAMCWAQLSFAQLQASQLSKSIESGYKSLELAKATRNVWVQMPVPLISGLLEAGRYEEALALTQQAIALTKILPPTLNFHRMLTILGSTYQALQLWEEAHNTLTEAVTMAEQLDFKGYAVPIVSRLCLLACMVGAWEEAYTYALQAIALRKRSGNILIQLDFFRPYEIEALLHAGNEQQVREEIHHMEHSVGSNQRFRIPFLWSKALLAAREGSIKQAIGQLHEAIQLATTIGLPGEQWQIRAALGIVYEAAGEQAQALAAFEEAAIIIEELADNIKDKALRSRFLTGPQIAQVLQHARYLASSMSIDPSTPKGL